MQTKRKEIPNKILIEKVAEALENGHTATLRVRGYSMRPFLETDRDIVKLKRPACPGLIKVGDAVLGRLPNDIYVLHRVIRRDGNKLILMGDGNIYSTETLFDTDVIGVVTAFYRKGRSVPDLVTGLKWRVYSVIWMKLKPLRRILLGIYRRQPWSL